MQLQAIKEMAGNEITGQETLEFGAAKPLSNDKTEFSIQFCIILLNASCYII